MLPRTLIAVSLLDEFKLLCCMSRVSIGGYTIWNEESENDFYCSVKRLIEQHCQDMDDDIKENTKQTLCASLACNIEIRCALCEGLSLVLLTPERSSKSGKIAQRLTDRLPNPELGVLPSKGPSYSLSSRLLALQSKFRLIVSQTLTTISSSQCDHNGGTQPRIAPVFDCSELGSPSSLTTRFSRLSHLRLTRLKVVLLIAV